MSDYWPTFDCCPECGALLWTDAETDGAWCENCEFSITQTSLDL